MFVGYQTRAGSQKRVKAANSTYMRRHFPSQTMHHSLNSITMTNKRRDLIVVRRPRKLLASVGPRKYAPSLPRNANSHSPVEASIMTFITRIHDIPSTVSETKIDRRTGWLETRSNTDDPVAIIRWQIRSKYLQHVILIASTNDAF